MNQKPSIGRIVHFVTATNRHIPGIIVFVNPADPSIVNLAVFGNDPSNPTQNATGSRYSDVCTRDTWHFPERDIDQAVAEAGNAQPSFGHFPREMMQTMGEEHLGTLTNLRNERDAAHEVILTQSQLLERCGKWIDEQIVKDNGEMTGPLSVYRNQWLDGHQTALHSVKDLLRPETKPVDQGATL